MQNSQVLNFNNEENSVDLLYDDEDMIIASVDLFHIDEEGSYNRNRCNISRQCADKSLKTFYNKPIIFRYDSTNKNLVTDVTEHDQGDDDNKFNTRIAGHIPADSRITFVERENGKTYCNAEVVMQKRYVPQLYDILKERDGNIKVSIEIKAYGDTNDEGVFIIDKFVLNGICLLGKEIEEGIENSHLEVLKFSKKEIETMNEVYLKFSQKKDKGETVVMNNSLDLYRLIDKIRSEVDKILNEDSDNMYGFGLDSIFLDENFIIVQNYSDRCFYKYSFEIQEDSSIIIDVDSKIEVKKEWEEIEGHYKDKSSLIFSKKEYGSGKTLKVDKSRDSLSDKKWGDVDKTKLRHDVLYAKNYKDLVKEVYAEVEEGWEDSPATKLKYPIMLLENGTFVYSRYGLASALAYAKAEENVAVVNKVEKLYRTMNIKEKEENMENSEKDLLENVDDKNQEIDNKKKQEELQNALTHVSDDVDAEKGKKSDNGDLEFKYSELENKYSELNKEFNDLENSFKQCSEELKTYKEKEDKQYMKEYLQSFSKCFNDEELKEMENKIENTKRAEFVKEVDEKIKDFVRSMSNEKKDINNSLLSVSVSDTNEKNNNNECKDIDDVLDSFKTK